MDGIAAYKDNAVSTQSRGRLIVMLYEGAIKALKQAVAQMQAGQVAEKGASISKALAILAELDASLNMEAGGEIAANLRSLYDFMFRHLTKANIRCDPQPVREVIALLEDLNEGWKAVTS